MLANLLIFLIVLSVLALLPDWLFNDLLAGVGLIMFALVFLSFFVPDSPKPRKLAADDRSESEKLRDISSWL